MWKTVPFHVKKEFFRGLMQSLAFRKNGKRNNANKQANKLTKGNKQNEKKKQTNRKDNQTICLDLDKLRQK